MIRTRQYRTKVFREQVEDEWKEKWKEQFWNVIEDNIDKPWNWICLSKNPNITIDIVLAYPEQYQ